jgi:hypothetical protein
LNKLKVCSILVVFPPCPNKADDEQSRKCE